jgi:hypothetical protein
MKNIIIIFHILIAPIGTKFLGEIVEQHLIQSMNHIIDTDF